LGSLDESANKPSGILKREMFATCKLALVYVGLGIPAGLFGIPYSLAVGNTGLLYRMVVGRILPWGVRAAGIRVSVTGRERVPAGVACIILPNHVSNLDPPVVFPAVPGMAAAMLKKELMRIPLLGTGMRLGGFVPVERSSRREDAQASVEKAAETLQRGLHMLIFAEGTRSKDGRLQPFKRGPFYLAVETGAPIVPVILTGTEKMMRKGSVAITPGTAHVEFLDPVWPKDFATREELMEAVRERMVAALPEAMKPSNREP
jgi:1-acyl-sn-glycerol-3-phosphate acyltransferase